MGIKGEGRPGGRPKGSASKLAKKALPIDWQDDAACLGDDSSLFFLQGTHGMYTSYDQEKNLPGKYLRCLPSANNDDTECPVRKQCLQYAVANKEPHGIWGGMTTRERKRYAKERLDS